MESILWNKVPLELQQELKEIPDGSVQELLQKLLRAEATIQERARRKRRSIRPAHQEQFLREIATVQCKVLCHDEWNRVFPVPRVVNPSEIRDRELRCLCEG